MNEVEKMYRNSGIEKHKKTMLDIETGKDVLTLDSFYPEFTAKKQMFLLQWLLDKTDLYLHRHKTDFTYSIASDNFTVNKYKDFKESIAEFINAIWQNLTEEERKQIKEVLE